MRAKASATSASRSSLRRRLPLWSRSAMPIWASASFASPVPCAASAARRVKRCSAMPSVCCSTPDAWQQSAAPGAPPRRPRSCRPVFPIADPPPRSSGRSARRDHRPSRRRSARRPACGCPYAAAPPGGRGSSAPRGPLARALDALQALLAALADRDQRGLDLPPPSTARRIAYVWVRRAMVQPTHRDRCPRTWVVRPPSRTGVAEQERHFGARARR